jgi:hypothetical protein
MELEGERLLPSGPIPPELYALLERLDPDSPPEERAQQVRAALDRWDTPHHYCQQPQDREEESAITAFWHSPTPDTAAAWLATTLPAIDRVRRRTRQERHQKPARWKFTGQRRFGPYLVDSCLGFGGDGIALHARHTETGQEVTVKKPGRGDVTAFSLLGDDWHPCLIRALDTGVSESGDEWVAREYTSDGTLHDLLQQRHFQPLPLGDAVTVFATCCQAVAWLHSKHVYRWSAHTKNVFRFGDRWKIGDLGRSLFFLPREHPVIGQLVAIRVDAAGCANDAVSRAAALWMIEHSLWRHPTCAGILPYNMEREQRLRVDDCSALAGLLVDILAPGHRWDLFHQALKGRPLCSAAYTITGHKQRDKALSAIINRAWRGDEGGAPLLASQGKGEQSVYEDPLELLRDVQNVLA